MIFKISFIVFRQVSDSLTVLLLNILALIIRNKLLGNLLFPADFKVNIPTPGGFSEIQGVYKKYGT